MRRVSFSICEAMLAAVVQGVGPIVRNANNEPARYIFSFGDSYSTTGFDPSGNRPTTQHPFGNPSGIPNSFTVNGPNWLADFVEDNAPKNTVCYNYACMGALVDNKLIHEDWPIPSFADQVDQFIVDTANPLVPWTASNSVFTIWFGINDVNSQFGDEDTEESRKVIFTKDVESYVLQLQKLRQAGARKFVVILVPPIARTPGYAVEAPTMIPTVERAVNIFNELLSHRVREVLETDECVTSAIYDPASIFNEVLDNPGRYGSPDAFCVNWDGRTCLFHDVLHPGVVIHQKLGDDMVDTMRKVGFL